jgi:hypothetical protein
MTTLKTNLPKTNLLKTNLKTDQARPTSHCHSERGEAVRNLLFPAAGKDPEPATTGKGTTSVVAQASNGRTGGGFSP